MRFKVDLCQLNGYYFQPGFFHIIRFIRIQEDLFLNLAYKNSR